MRKLLALLVLATSLTACGGDSGTNPNATFEGTYSLKTVNNSPLPYTITDGSDVLVINSDVITINAGGTWSEDINYRVTSGGVTSTNTDTDGGTWTRNGSTVTLNSNQGSDGYDMTWANGTLRVDYPGFILLFSK